MSDNAYKPAGYCPHCGYATDPGVCPECGKNVAVDELDFAPYWVARKRKIRRAVAAALLLAGLCFGGWYLYARCNWIAWVPSRLLLAVNEGGFSRSNMELWRRFCAGALSAEQTDRLLASSLRTAKGLVIRNPYSTEADVEIRLEVTKDIRAGGWRVWCPARQVTVGGRPVSVTDNVPGPDWPSGTGPPSGDRYCMRIQRLSPGPHTIQVVLTYELLPESAVTRQSRSPVRTMLVLSTAILVEDKPITSYIREVWESDVDRSGFFRLAVSKDPWHHMTSVSFVGLPTPVAARLEYRTAGASAYRKLLAVYAPAGQRYSWAFSLSQTERLEPGSVVDLRLVPDLEVAWYAGCTSCFGGTVEWSGVPVPSGPRTFAPTWPATAPVASFLQPTRIYHATATTASE